MPYANKHKANFIKGTLAAMAMVLTRVAMPWPFRGIIEGLFQEKSGSSDFWMNRLPDGLNGSFAMGLAFLALVVLFGHFDHLERLCFSRFAIGTVRDLRRDALRSVMRKHRKHHDKKKGDVISRLIGDTARMKNGLKGFFVHILPNLFVFLAVTIILFFMNVRLGFIFAMTLLAVCLMTYLSAIQIFKKSLKHRKKEGKLSDTILDVLDDNGETQDRAAFNKLSKTSGRYEASLTLIEGRTTWAACSLFGLAILAAISIGATEVSNHRLGMGDMVVFMMYAIMMRAPIMQISRYGCRMGKLLGPAHRVLKITKKKVSGSLRLSSNMA